MCERYPGYLFGGTPVSSWDRSFNPLENQIQQQYRGRIGPGARCWGSMSEGGGVSAAGDTCKTNLIVNYLPQTMTEKDLYAMFMSIGSIESCRVMKDFKTGYSYGFGFVNFTREEDAARAIDTFNGYRLRNKRLKVSYARPSGDDIKDTNLYVSNLPRAITDEQLETIFGKYGRIVQKHILRDKNNGTPRGIAFVRFDKREEAQEAIAALNNVIPEGGTEPLSVKVAEEHGKQKAAYYAGYAAGFQQNRGNKPLSKKLLGLSQPYCSTQGDFSWGYGNCVVPEPWDSFATPPLGGSHPNTPRNGCRTGACANARVTYPNCAPNKGTPRPPRAARNLTWAPTYPDERFKPQRCRNSTAPYW